MLSERKSLIRFLIIYIFSTIFLIAIGEYFYYQLAKNSQIDKQKLILENKIDNYLKERVKIRKFRDFNLLENMVIYKNKKIVAYSFKPPKIDFTKEVWIENNKVFYLKKLIRPFGEIYILTYKDLPKDDLKFKLMIFSFFILCLILIIAYFLGKLFLAPMKDNIYALENFIRDSTHEMNTPISIINANIEILKLKHIDYKEFNRIESATKRLNKIFNDLKFLSLKKESILEDINLKQLILERIEYFELKASLELEDIILKVDKEDMLRIIDNLLSNAKKYSNNFINIKITKNYILIENDGEIKDTKNVVKKFVRENQNEGGFGLGLYIVDKICKKYNWKLEIKNEFNRVLVYVWLM